MAFSEYLGTQISDLLKSTLCYTVVKRGHTEGIGREKTLSQKSTVIAFQLEWQVVLALEGITLKSKLPRTLPSNYKLPLIFEEMNSF